MTLGTNYVMSFKLTAFLFILISAQLFIDSKALNEKHFINFQWVFFYYLQFHIVS